MMVCDLLSEGVEEGGIRACTGLLILGTKVYKDNQEQSRLLRAQDDQETRGFARDY